MGTNRMTVNPVDDDNYEQTRDIDDMNDEPADSVT